MFLLFILKISIDFNGVPPPSTSKIQRGFYKEDDRFAIHLIYEDLPEYKITQQIDGEDVSIIYRAKKPFSSPQSGYQIPNNAGVADLWACFKTQEKCVPFGYHSAEIKEAKTDKYQKPEISDPDKLRINKFHYVLQGFGKYMTRIHLVETMGAGSSYNNEPVSLTKVNDTMLELTLNISSLNWTDVFQFTYPDTKTQPIIEYTNRSLYFYELSSNNTYIEYSLEDTKSYMYFRRNVVSHQVYYEPTWFLNFNKLIPCPVEYDCTRSNQTSANMWLCYDTIDEEHFCYPAIDLRYGFRLTSSNMYFNSSFSPNIKVEMKLECDPTINGLDDITRTTAITASKDTNPRTYSFDLKTNLTCPKEFVIKPIEKHYTSGALFVVIVWMFIIVFVCGGIIVNYILDGSLALPLTSIWSDVGYYIIDGWNITTCAHNQSVKDAQFEQNEFAPTTKYASI